MDPHSHLPPEGLACFWWYAIESQSFAWLELVDSLVHFIKRDRAINFHQLFFLGDKVKDAEVNWLMITKHTIEVWTEDSHVFATVGRQSSIGKSHCYVDRFLVMRCFATHEDANVFPRESWAYLHAMNVQTNIAVPARFGKENLVFHLFCHTFQAAL